METNAAGYTPVTLAARLGSKVIAKLSVRFNPCIRGRHVMRERFALRHRVAAHQPLALAQCSRGWSALRLVGLAGYPAASAEPPDAAALDTRLTQL